MEVRAVICFFKKILQIFRNLSLEPKYVKNTIRILYVYCKNLKSVKLVERSKTNYLKIGDKSK